MINFNKKEFFYFEYAEIEKIITDHYKIKEYNIASIEEKSNDSAIICHVEPEEPDEYSKKQFQNLENSNYTLHAVLNDLCNKKVIPEGKYIINISW